MIPLDISILLSQLRNIRRYASLQFLLQQIHPLQYILKPHSMLVDSIHLTLKYWQRKNWQSLTSSLDLSMENTVKEKKFYSYILHTVSPPLFLPFSFFLSLAWHSLWLGMTCFNFLEGSNWKEDGHWATRGGDEMRKNRFWTFFFLSCRPCK